MRNIKFGILIPRGKPPVELVPSLFNQPETGEVLATGGDMNLYGAMQNNESAGLSDGSDALSEAMGGPPSKVRKGKAHKSDKSSWKPEHFSDEDLISWATACREAHLEGFLKVSALKYWLRYTFQSYSSEYRELGKRLEEVVR